MEMQCAHASFWCRLQRKEKLLPSKAYPETESTRYNKPGWKSMCRNVATVRLDRSCRLRHCSKRKLILQTLTSTTPCRVIYVGAEPTQESGRRSKLPLRKEANYESGKRLSDERF